jgi:hypothetical protein
MPDAQKRPADDEIAFDLFKCHMMSMCKKALAVHDCLAAAYLERTGLVLERETEYTVEDLRRASRLLRANYDRDGNEK